MKLASRWVWPIQQRLLLHPIIKQAAYKLYNQGIMNGSLLLNALMPLDGPSPL
jgi:hypothetical protein